MGEHLSPEGGIQERNRGRVDIAPVDMNDHRRIREYVGIPVPGSGRPRDDEPSFNPEPPDLYAPRFTALPAYRRQIDGQVTRQIVGTGPGLVGQSSLGLSV